jgi:hypothetical protein
MTLKSTCRQVLVATLYAVILTACSDDRGYKIPGMADKICVPQRHVVNVPWWLFSGDSKYKNEGFAFTGCWRSDSDNQDGCALPDVVSSGTVGAVANVREWKWRSIDPGALFHDIVYEQGTKIEIQGDGTSIVISNPNRLDGWLIWKKEKPVPIDKLAHLEGGDELLAICRKDTGFRLPVHRNATEPVYYCDRQLTGQFFYVTYSFYSTNRIPQNIAEIDAGIISAIESWHCK